MGLLFHVNLARSEDSDAHFILVAILVLSINHDGPDILVATQVNRDHKKGPPASAFALNSMQCPLISGAETLGQSLMTDGKMLAERLESLDMGVVPQP